MTDSRNQPLNVVVTEDDPLMQESFRLLLEGQQLSLYTSVDDFFARSSPELRVDLILMDLRHDRDPNGERTISLIPELRQRHPLAELVIQSGIDEVSAMRACIQQGASRFILKDHLSEEVPILVERMKELRHLRTRLDQDILGESPVMRQLKKDLLELRFQPNVDVLVEGETGTGKELCARALHNNIGQWIAVNVSAVPMELFEAEFFGAEKGAYTGAAQARQGYLEAAAGGTLFLDEIQSLHSSHQSKLLRVLETRTFTRVGSSQERPFRARVVSASNQSLKEAVSKGRFREDLYYRLAPLTLQVPPLRLRGSDIPLLANHFLTEHSGGKTRSFTNEGLQYLKEWEWPGNVRELRGLVRSLVIKSPIPRLDEPEIRLALGSADEVATLASTGGAGFAIDWSLGLDENVENLERFLLRETLSKHKSVEARDLLKLARSRFYEKVKQYGLLK